MLPLKPFFFCEPKDWAELKTTLGTMDDRAKLLAGGTDLIPNLKHGLYDVNRLISLKRIDELRFISTHNNSDETITVSIGVLTTLNKLCHDATIIRFLQALAKASSHIASPQIRNMGTIGGNICLDTRCLYFNQTEFWRSALGFCLKKDGCSCHVVKTGKRCVAASSNDLATVLLAYNATIQIETPSSSQTLLLDDFYTANGEKNHQLNVGNMVSLVKVTTSPSTRAGFFKLRMRDSIDFPMLSTAVCFRLDQQQCIHHGTVVVNALVAKPKVISLAQFDGRVYNQELIDTISQMVQQKCHPQTNIAGDTTYRKLMIAVSVKRAFHNALACADE